MGPTRFPYGEAKGFANAFQFGVGPSVSGTAGLITSGDTTPDVTVGSLFYTNNTSNTTITYFDLQDYGNRAPNYEGKIITVFFLDNSTQLANSGQVFLATTNNLIGSNNSIDLMHSRSGWYELRRSYVNRTEVSVLAINANSSADVNGVKLLVLNNTGGTTTSLIALSNGQVGQEVTVVQQGSNSTRIITGGNIYMTATGAVLINASGAYKLVKVNGTDWRMLAVNSGGAF